MTGLILKDLLNLMRGSKQIVLVLIMYLALSFWLNNNTFAPMMLVFFLAYQVISTFAYDDIVKWERFAMTMPVKRKQIVQSKYLLLVILTGGGVVVGCAAGALLNVIHPTGDGGLIEIVASSLAVGGVFLLMFSIQIPFLFRYGAEKARMFLIIIFMIPALLVYGGIALAKRYQVTLPSESTVKLLIGLAPVVLLVLLIISYMVSVKVFDKKEL